MTPTPQHHPLAHALPLFLLAGVCLTALDTTAKYLVRDHSLFLVVWARYIGQMLVVTPFARHRAGPAFWRTRNLRMQLARSAFLLAATSAAATAICRSPKLPPSFLAPSSSSCCRDPVLGERPTRALGSGNHGLCRNPRAAAAGSSILHPAVVCCSPRSQRFTCC
jgi:hypothetical protein